MHIHLSPRHLALTGAINSYVVNKLAHLDNQSDHIIAAHVVLLHDDSKKKSNYVVKVHLAVPGPDIHAEDREDDLYAAIDLVMGKLARQLRKRKTRLVTGKKHKAQKATERRKRGL
ncbi:MAG: ribosome hibernation-promoting factor, HPF/YfiA family [Chthoniobacterales bacterium]|jgi:putative sigma-54 modulation protein